MLIRAGTDVNQPDKYGRVPLSIAAAKGHVPALLALKAAGADVNYSSEESQETPIFDAAGKGHVKAIQTLKALGANVEKMSAGKTPLYRAACEGHALAILALTTSGANVNQRNQDVEEFGGQGHTAVFGAAIGNHPLTISALKSAGADINIEDCYGQLPISNVAWATPDRAAVICSLKAAGSTVNIIKNVPFELQNPILYSVTQSMSLEETIALLASGAEVETTNIREGNSLFYIASQRAGADITDTLGIMVVLAAAGADVNKANNRQQTPLANAIKKGQTELINVLKALGAVQKNTHEASPKHQKRKIRS